ncbi:MAG: RluA family pseudouridine synthase [Pseudomonadota bacterium]
MSGVMQRTVSDDETGMRLDRWFRTHYPAVRHGALEKLLRTGQIRVDGGRVKAARRLEAGEVVRVPPIDAAEPAPAKRAPKPMSAARAREQIAAMTLYEDDAVLALAKPFGLPVQGGRGAGAHIDAYLQAIARDPEDRARLVHRLDRDTGGLLLVAKSRRAAAALSGAFQRREIDKTYWALVVGAPSPREGTIDFKIAPRMVRVGDQDQERIAPSDADDAKKAFTDFQTVDDAGGGVAFVALKPITGRKHQLRVHCAASGAPIVGDRKYGGARAVVDGVSDRLHLFCREMTVRHPTTGRKLTLRAPLDGHMAQTWRFFGFDAEATVAWPERETGS